MHYNSLFRSEMATHTQAVIEGSRFEVGTSASSKRGVKACSRPPHVTKYTDSPVQARP